MTTSPTIRVQGEDFDLQAEIDLLCKGKPGIGAVVTFSGLCRDEGGTLDALELEHYPGMAEAEMTRIAEMAIERFKLNGLTAIHRYGKIAAGENIVLVIAAAPHRQAAFDEERAEWQRSGEFDRVTALTDGPDTGALASAAIELPEGSEMIEAPFGGSVWKLLVAPGDTVKAGDVIAVIEAMKMECPLESPASGTIAALYIQERQSVQPGSPMLALRQHP